MSQGHAIPLAHAQRVADGLVELLTPVSERILIVGSVRRRKPHCGDVELCAIPRVERRDVVGVPLPLFGDPDGEVVNLIWEALDGLVQQGRAEPGNAKTWPAKRIAGAKMLSVFLPRAGCKAEVYMPTRETWGCIATIRTGSADFSHALVTTWRKSAAARRFEGGRVWDGGHVFDTPEERDVFEVCGVQWAEYEKRLGWNDVQPRK